MKKKLKLARKLLSIALVMTVAFTFSFVSPKLADSTAYADETITFATNGVGDVSNGYKVEVKGASASNGMYVVEFTGESFTVPTESESVGGKFGAVDTTTKSVQYTVKTDATAEQINTDLSAITYVGSGSISITAVKQAPKSGNVYYNGNGHYYKLITEKKTWWEAMKDSMNASSDYTDYKAHPLTITSPGEMDVVKNLCGSNKIWLGAVPSGNTSERDISSSDSLPTKKSSGNVAGKGSTWIWIWNTPEAGTTLPDNPTDSSGKTVCTYWHGGEPSGGTTKTTNNKTETLADTYVLCMSQSGVNVLWDDLDKTVATTWDDYTAMCYVIEYSPYNTTNTKWVNDDNNTNVVKTTSGTYDSSKVTADSSADTDTNISFAAKGVGDVENGYTVKVTGATANNEMYIVEFTGDSFTVPTNPAGGTFGTIDEGTKSVRYTLTTSATNANVNADLSAIKYVGSGEISITAVKQAPKTGDVYYNDNGHYYRLVATAEEWWDAMTKSADESNNGDSGYTGYKAHPLTITSSGENEVVKALRAKISGGDGKIWLGAVPSGNTSDNDIESDSNQNSNKSLPKTGYDSKNQKDSGAGWTWIWIWNTPEAGNTVPSNDTSDTGYKYWATGEPNGGANDNGASYVLCMNANGVWDDLYKTDLSNNDGYKTMQYIIEYSPYNNDGWASDSVDKKSSTYSNDNISESTTEPEHSGGSSSGSSKHTSELAKAKTEAKAEVKAQAEAQKYDEAEAAEVAEIKAQAEKDITAAKTVDEVNKIKAEAEAKIDAVNTAEENAEIKAVRDVNWKVFKARSKKSTLHGKKAIKVYWNLPDGISVDGYEVYRSTSRYSGYGTEPYFTTTNTTYKNNKDLKSGKMYYYKVRGYKMINGEKVYTGWSAKAFRRIK